MSTVNIKRGDTKGLFIDTLTLNDVEVDLTGCTVKFIMRRRGKEPKLVNQDAVVLPDPDAVTPRRTVEYQPIEEDVADPGVFEQEWQVMFPSGRPLTFPNGPTDGEFNTVNISRDLGD